MATTIEVTLELPDDPWDFSRPGHSYGQISQTVKVLKDGREIGTALVTLPLKNPGEMGRFTQGGAHVLRERGLI